MRYHFPALLMLSVFALGCGSGEPVPVPVRGTVTLDGVALAEGQISFITPGQVPEVIDIKNGSFDGKAKWGNRRVEIAAYRPVRITPDVPKHVIPLMEGGKENYMPDKYHKNSTLSADVQASGPNEFKFELLSK